MKFVFQESQPEFKDAEEFDYRYNEHGFDTGQSTTYAFIPPDPVLVPGAAKVIHTHITPAFARRVSTTTANAKVHSPADAYKSDSNNTRLNEFIPSHLDHAVDPGHHYNESHSQIVQDFSGRVWIKDFPAYLVSGYAGIGGLLAATKISDPSHGRKLTLRMIIYPMYPQPPQTTNSGGDESTPSLMFPQCFKCVLTCPTEDLFFHWTFICTPFSFKTLARFMKWEFPPTAGSSESHAFLNFNTIIKERVIECATMPDRFKAKLRIDIENKCASLVFVEVVKLYRVVHLLCLDFRPSEWNEIKMGVKTDYTNIQERYDTVKECLVKVLDTVAKYQPSLLLSDLGPSNATIRQPQHWKTTIDHLLPSEIQTSSSQRLMTEEERISRKKAFILSTMPDINIKEPIYSKTCWIHVMLPNMTDQSESIFKQLTFTFYAKGTVKDPLAYAVIVTDHKDIFFSYSSENITPGKFAQMTRHLDVHIDNPNKPGKENGNKPGLLDLDTLMHRRIKPDYVMRERKHRLGYHPEDGIGGVLGVVAGDMLAGVEEEPDRYMAILHLSPREEDKPVNPFAKKRAPSTKPIQTTLSTTKKSVHENKPAISEIGLVSLTEMPEPRKAKLSFIQRSLFRVTHLLTINFSETPRDDIKDVIQEKYLHLNGEMETCRARLDKMLDIVRKRNFSLWKIVSELKRPVILAESPFFDESKSLRHYEQGPKRFTTSTSDDPDEREIQRFDFPSPEKDRDVITRIKNAASFVKKQTDGSLFDEDGTIPQRPVVKMRIPVQSLPQAPTNFQNELEKWRKYDKLILSTEPPSQPPRKPSKVTDTSSRKDSIYTQKSKKNYYFEHTIPQRDPYNAMLPDQLETGDWKTFGI